MDKDWTDTDWTDKDWGGQGAATREAMGEVIDLEGKRKAREAALKRRAQALRDAEQRQVKQDDPEGPPTPGRDGGAGQV